MKKIKALILDIDGTLYPLDDRDQSEYSSSKLGGQIHANCERFFQEKLGFDTKLAKEKYQELRERYNNEVSLAVEKEFGVNRSEYFKFTWDLKVDDIVQENEALTSLLAKLKIKTGILTSAPKIWAQKVLKHLGVFELFDGAIFTGEPDIRKPNPLAFKQLADLWSLDPVNILAVGDQEHTDILPAKSLGMMTARIARNASTEADFIAPDLVMLIELLKKKKIL